MSSSRDITSKLENDAPRLFKDIWLYCVIRHLDIQTLLDFSAATKETRQLAFTELFKRHEFIDNINRKITMHELFCRERSSYCERTFEKFQRFAVGAFILGILFIMAQDTWLNLNDADYEKMTIRATLLTLMMLVLLTSIYVYATHNTNQQSRQVDQFVTREKVKATALKYLRDELPNQRLSTHGLFREFTDTSNHYDQPTSSCTIL